jgi:hypothetical protein
MADFGSICAKKDIFVRTISGEILTMSVDIHDTFMTVMSRIQTEQGIPVGRQNIVITGENLSVDEALPTSSQAEKPDITAAGGSSELFTQTTDSSFVPDWSQASSVDQNHNREQLRLVKFHALLSLFRYLCCQTKLISKGFLDTGNIIISVKKFKRITVMSPRLIGVIAVYLL